MKVCVVVPMDGGPGDWAEALAEIRRHVGDGTALVLVDPGGLGRAAAEALLQRLPGVEYVSISPVRDPDDVVLAGMEMAPAADALLVYDPRRDDARSLAPLVEALRGGADIATVDQGRATDEGMWYRAAKRMFSAAHGLMSGFGGGAEAARFRGMSRRVVAHVTAHVDAEATHRLLPAMAGFRRAVVKGSPGGTLLPPPPNRSFLDGVRRGLALVSASSDVPLRLASGFCLLGAAASLAFSGYAALVYVLRDEVAPGWTTLSLQINALFFLLSMAMFALSEYVLAMGRRGRRRYLVLSSLSSLSSLGGGSAEVRNVDRGAGR